MYPLSFSEFLDACGYTRLNEAIKKANPNTPLPDYIHNLAVEHLRKFLIIGGMPEAVAKYIETDGNIYEAANVLTDLNVTLKSDFSKYSERVPQLRINAVFEALVAQMGNKFVYAKVAEDFHLSQIKECIDLLVMAGLAIPVIHTHANGVPLGAEINPKKQKYLMLDTGLYQNLAALNVSEIMLGKDFSFVNKGKIAELFAGLEIIKTGKNNTFQQLYYWQREAKKSNAEVDYIVQKGEKIIPIEIKAGTKGRMQSLHLFLKEKNVGRGVRCSLENFAHYDNIDVYPLYAISNII
ncbi:hypothetical protein FACS1894176_06960 [Bacteroidia bacterium]|nr:hypothetical protein FACS1894176_06960 [Bacteroidia bacterium]